MEIRETFYDCEGKKIVTGTIVAFDALNEFSSIGWIWYDAEHVAETLSFKITLPNFEPALFDAPY